MAKCHREISSFINFKSESNFFKKNVACTRLWRIYLDKYAPIYTTEHTNWHHLFVGMIIQKLYLT